MLASIIQWAPSAVWRYILSITIGDSIKIKVEGSDEHTAADGIKRFMTEHSI